MLDAVSFLASMLGMLGAGFCFGMLYKQPSATLPQNGQTQTEYAPQVSMNKADSFRVIGFRKDQL